jgi:hypothetical protein
LQLLYHKQAKAKKEANMKKMKNKKSKVYVCEHNVPVEMSKPNESQKDMVKGQGKILAEKKRSATWY